MKTFEEHLQDAVGATYPLQDILANLSTEEILEEVNIFAKEVAREALKNAAENARVMAEDIVTGNRLDVASWTDSNNFKFSVSKPSILSDKNIPEL